MRLPEIVSLYSSWSERNFPLPDRSKSLMKLTEEVGELNAAVYRGDKAAVEDALGDVFFALLGAFRAFDFDLRRVALKVWQRIKDRDYVAHPATGRPQSVTIERIK